MEKNIELEKDRKVKERKVREYTVNNKKNQRLINRMLNT